MSSGGNLQIRNNKIRRDAHFTSVTIGSSNTSVGVIQIVPSSYNQPVLAAGNLIYDSELSTIVISDGKSWIPLAGVNTNKGTGIGVFSKTENGVSYFKSLKSVLGTIDITEQTDGTINLETKKFSVSSQKTGDLIYAASNTDLSSIAIGGQNMILSSDGTKPVWRNLSLANNPINVGSGIGIYKGLSGEHPQLKTLVAGSGVNITPSDDQISISVDSGKLFPENISGSMIFNIGSGLAQLPPGLENQMLYIENGFPIWKTFEHLRGENVGEGAELISGEYTKSDVLALKKINSDKTIGIESTDNTLVLSVNSNALFDTENEGSLLYINNAKVSQLDISESGKHLASDGTKPIWVNIPEVSFSGEGVSYLKEQTNLTGYTFKTLKSDDTITIAVTSDDIQFSTSPNQLFGTSDNGVVNVTNGVTNTMLGRQGEYLSSNGTTAVWKHFPEFTYGDVGTPLITVLNSESPETGNNTDYTIKNIDSSTGTVKIVDGEHIDLNVDLTKAFTNMISGALVYASSESSIDLLQPPQNNAPHQLVMRDNLNMNWEEIPIVKNLVNVGTGIPILAESSESTENFRTITSNSSIDVSVKDNQIELKTDLSKLLPSSSGIVTMNNTSPEIVELGAQNNVLSINSGKMVWRSETVGGCSNIGSGIGLFSDNENGMLNFRTLTSENLDIVESGQTIDINANLEKLFPDVSSGDLLVGSGTSFEKLNIGTKKYVLCSDGQKPIWEMNEGFTTQNTLVVCLTPGPSQFSCISDAMDSIPTPPDEAAPSETNPWVIYLYAGHYKEPKTVVFKPYVYIIGADIGGVLVEPESPGYDLFHFTKATSLSFCSIGNVDQNCYACKFIDTGYVDSEFALLHKVNIYNSKVYIEAKTINSLVYFEYVSYSGETELTNTIEIISTTENYSYLSIENHFVETTANGAVVLVDGPESYLYCQLCNFIGVASGIKIQNGGHSDIRASYFEAFENAITVETSGTNPSVTISNVTFQNNQINVNIKNSTTEGYLSGYSEYLKTIVNPLARYTFFITNSNQRIITVSSRGANFSSISEAVLAVNPVLECEITTGSTILKSNNLFKAEYNSVLVSAPGLQLLTTVEFIDESTMELSLPATATATVNVKFNRATDTSAYTILVQPGTYIEPPIELDSYINISGVNRDTCIVVPGFLTPGALFELKDNTSITDINITGVHPDSFAIHITDAIHTFVGNMIFYAVNKAISVTGGTIDFVTEITNCIFMGGLSDTGIEINNQTDTHITVSISDMKCIQHFDSFLRIKGENSVTAVRNCALQSDDLGTALTIYDNAKVHVQGLYLSHWNTGIASGDNTGSCYLAISGLTQTDVGLVLDITNPNTSGYFNGYIPYGKHHITDACPFFITNKDSKIIQVSKKGGDFETIQAAIDSITDAAADNIYTISVGPGIFIENPIVLKSFIGIRGSGSQATVVLCNQPDGSVITGADSSLVYGITFSGCTEPGGNSVYFEGTGTEPGAPFIVDNCILGDSYTMVAVNSESFPATMILSNCLYGATFDADEGITVKGNNSQLATLLVYNCVFQDLITPVPQTLIDIDGDNALVVASNVLIQLNGTNTSTAMKMRNGGGARIYNCAFVGLNNGVVTENVGNAPGLVMSASSFERCNTMLNIQHPGTTGSFLGSIDISKAYIHPNSTFYIRDRVTTNLIVSKTGSDYHSIAEAVSYIQPTIYVNVTAGSQYVTPTTGYSFNPSLDGCLITGSGVQPSTVFNYISTTSGFLSSNVDAGLLTTLDATTDVVELTLYRSSSLNGYVISVQPGVYTEQNFVLPNFTTLKGESKETCTVVPADPTSTLITLGKRSSISNITISGATSGIGVRVDGNYDSEFNLPAEILYSCIQNCNHALYVSSTLGRTNLRCTGLSIRGTCAIGVHIDGSLGTTGINTIESLFNDLLIRSTADNHTGFLCEGPNSNVIIKSSSFLSSRKPGSSGIVLSDGCTMILTGSQIFSTTLDGVAITSDGDGPILSCNGCTFFKNLGNDINIEHPDASGCLTMITAETNKVDIHPNSKITVSYVDPTINGTTLLGDVNVGSTSGQTTNIIPMLNYDTTIGLLSGGTITQGESSLSVVVSAGTGYLKVDDKIFLVEFPETHVVLPDESQNYLYVDSSSQVLTSSSKPSFVNIFLGRTATKSNAIEFIENIPIRCDHITNKHDEFNRNAIGAVVYSGIQVTASGLNLGITSGVYYYSGLKFSVSAVPSPARITEYFHNDQNQFVCLETTEVDNTVYDNGTGLEELGVGCYAKHMLYLVGETPKLMMVYAREYHVNQADAISGNNPVPPVYFNESVIPIAGLVVTPDNSEIIITDERPLVTMSLRSMNTELNHGNLQGLLDDDHKQYVLADGTRSLTGNMNLGGNAIINVSSIDGIDIGSHANRHMPGGEDPLTTAAPTTSLSATTTNSEGNANSYSRSDHVHSISTGAPSTLLTDRTNTTGTSGLLARADHVHNIPTAIAVDVGSSNSQGSSLYFARSDHVHQGIHSLTINDEKLFGDVTIQGGSGIIIQNLDGKYTFDVPIGGNEFACFITGNFEVSITSGRITKNGVPVDIDHSAVILPPSATGIIFLDNNNAFQFSTESNFSGGTIPIAYFETDDFGLVSVKDARSVLNSGFGLLWSGVITVDVNGSDSHGSKSGFPFKTVSKAMENALSGDIVVVNPGEYVLTSTLVIPQGITLYCRGSILTYPNMQNETTCIENHGKILNLALVGVSTVESVIQIGVGMYDDSVIEHSILNLTNTNTGSTNLYGIRSQSTTFTKINNTVITISSSGTRGIIRGIFVNSGSVAAKSCEIHIDAESLTTVGIEQTTNTTFTNFSGAINANVTSIGNVNVICTFENTNFANVLSIGGVLIKPETAQSRATVLLPDDDGVVALTENPQTLKNKDLTDITNNITCNNIRTTNNKIKIESDVEITRGLTLTAISQTEASWLPVKEYTSGDGIAVTEDGIISANVVSVSAKDSTVLIENDDGVMLLSGGYISGEGIDIQNNKIVNIGITDVQTTDTIFVENNSGVVKLHGGYISGDGITITNNIVGLSDFEGLGDGIQLSNSNKLKTIKAGDGINLQYDENTITVSSAGMPDATLTDSGIGNSLIIVGNGNDHIIKKIIAGDGVRLTDTGTGLTFSNDGTISITPGPGISITGTPSNPIISGGYTSGSGISINSGVITNNGVLSVTTDATLLCSTSSGIVSLSGNYKAGSGITITGNVITNSSPASSIVLSNASVIQGSISLLSDTNFKLKGVNPGSGISITSTPTDITVANTGVISVRASGSTVTIGGTTSNPIISGNYVSGVGISISGNVITNTLPSTNIVVSSSGGSYSLIGSGTNTIKGINSGNGISISSNSTSLTISNNGVLGITNSDGTVSIQQTTNGTFQLSGGYISGPGISITGNKISNTTISSYNIPNKIIVKKPEYKTIARLQCGGSGYSEGFVAYNITARGTTNIRVYDPINDVLFGGDINIGNSGTRLFNFTCPLENCLLHLQVLNVSGNGSILEGITYGWSG